MGQRNRIKEVVEVLKKSGGRLQRSVLIRQLEKKGIMSHETASKTINAAVESKRIFRQEDHKGGQKIVWLDATPDIEKMFSSLVQYLEQMVNSYDNRFSVFKEKFSSLTTDEKIDGVDYYTYFLNRILDVFEQIIANSPYSSKFSNLYEDVRSRGEEFEKLSSTCTPDESAQITANLISIRILDVSDALEDVDDYLKEITGIKNKK